MHKKPTKPVNKHDVMRTMYKQRNCERYNTTVNIFMQ